MEKHISSDNAAVDWVIDAKKGDIAVYHSYVWPSRLRPNMLCTAAENPDNRELRLVRDKVWSMSREGAVSLVQRRIGGEVQYLAVKR